MESTPRSRLLLCAAEPADVDDVRQLLEQAGYQPQWHPLMLDRPDELAECGMLLVQDRLGTRDGFQLCRRLRASAIDSFVPILFLTEDHSPSARQACLEAGADAYLLRPFTPGELLAQVQAFVRLRDLHERLTEKSAEVLRINQRLQKAHQQIDLELELARRIQRSFLPQALPEVAPVRFAVSYRPCSRVGGDFYDVFRLDEHHLGFYVADAMGHGVPASLLTIFIKKGVQAKEIFGKQYRLVPPDEVLQRLNRDLIDQALAETPFITMIYASLDCRARTFSFARAGHPHPLYIPATGEPELWQVHGSLLGIFDTEFSVATRTLQPGDKVLLYTDGLDLSGTPGAPSGMDRLLERAREHRALPIGDFVARLADDLLDPAQQADDFTLLGLEIAAY